MTGWCPDADSCTTQPCARLPGNHRSLPRSSRSRLELGLGVRAGCRGGPAVRKRGFLFFLNPYACSNTHIRGVTRIASTYGTQATRRRENQNESRTVWSNRKLGSTDSAGTHQSRSQGDGGSPQYVKATPDGEGGER